LGWLTRIRRLCREQNLIEGHQSGRGEDRAYIRARYDDVLELFIMHARIVLIEFGNLFDEFHEFGGWSRIGIHQVLAHSFGIERGIGYNIVWLRPGNDRQAPQCGGLARGWHATVLFLKGENSRRHRHCLNSGCPLTLAKCSVKLGNADDLFFLLFVCVAPRTFSTLLMSSSIAFGSFMARKASTSAL
jgi:hypothetical protein